MESTSPRSGLARAGETLLLCGAILHSLGGGVLLLFTALVLSVDLPGRSGPPAELMLFGTLGALASVSAAVLWTGYNDARAGRIVRAGIKGIVGALLLPVSVVPLLGGILLSVCEEAKSPTPVAPRPSRFDAMDIRQD